LFLILIALGTENLFLILIALDWIE